MKFGDFGGGGGGGGLLLWTEIVYFYFTYFCSCRSARTRLLEYFEQITVLI